MTEIGRKIREFLQCTFVGVILRKHPNVKCTRVSLQLLCCYDVIRHSAFDVIVQQEKRKKWCNVAGFRMGNPSQN